MTDSPSRGKALWDALRDGLRAYRRGPLPAGRGRPILWGVTHYGLFVGGMTMDAFLAQAGKVLLDSGRLYRWEDTLVFEFREADAARLLVLASRCRAEPGAAGVLSNLFGV